MQDRPLKLLSGWPMLVLVLAWAVGNLVLIGISTSSGLPALLLLLIPSMLGWFLTLFGFIVNSPNHARVVQLFGEYIGTFSDVGFYWGNPFYVTTKISLRTRTFETGVTQTEEVKDPTSGKVLSPATQSRRPSKVNDRDGTPIEIAAVVVWKVVSPANAAFTVDDYEGYIHIQSESALRNLASRYRYDGTDTDEFSLRGHIDEVAAQLKAEVEQRVQQAGVEIVEARISYLAYAPEIAAAMLQRQQAGAVIAARRLIVDGAVGMVEHAMDELSKKGVVQLDADRKAAMVCNLLVVLCGHVTPQPVLNTGSMHN